ncbi:Peptidase M20 domain-containing protein 2 [Varanus komodoensis]|nr:Peptidase M20 domain-containing protein 2 [Varanus komodoensis]
MKKAGLDESPVGIKIAGRNINNLRYADDTILMAESEEELRSLLMQVEEESTKVGLKCNIKKTKIMASGPLTSWQIDGDEMEVVIDFIFLGSKITADGDCSQEIKRRLLLGRKAMANLDSILKSRDITLPAEVCIVKAMIFPVAMYGCESWTIRKAERKKIEAFELWCWRRLLQVPWTARRSNRSVLEEINPDCSLEGQILKMKLKYFGQLMRRKDSLEKSLMLGIIDGKRRRGRQRMSVTVKYFGKAAHAAAYPWEGVNALDAAVLAYNNLSLLRQQMKPTWRVHGIIKNGGVKPNIIPFYAELEFYLRTPSLRELSILTEKAENCFKAAALATGCEVELKSGPNEYFNVLPNKSLEKAYIENGKKLGMDFIQDDNLNGLSGSTDFGNVSFVIPGIHPYFYIGSDALNHTEEYTTAAGSEDAQFYALRTAKALAMTALDVIFKPDLMEKAKEDFRIVRLKEEVDLNRSEHGKGSGLGIGAACASR